jgi:hypothetical protein
MRLETVNLEWLNSIIDAMWVVDGDGGVGPYMSQSIAKVLNGELERVPPGIAHIRMKAFTLGNHPPVIWSAATKYQIRNTTQCAKLHQEMVESTSQRHSWQHQKANKHTSIKSKKDFSVQLMNIIISLSQLVDVAIFTSTKLLHRFSTGSFFSNADDGASDDTNHTNHTNENLSKSTRRHRKSKLLNGYDPNNYKYKDRKYSNLANTRGCQLLVIDTEFGYASKDLEIVLGIRSNELQGMFTEITVALTELVFSGKLRLNIELIPEYPFFGNCTVS